MDNMAFFPEHLPKDLQDQKDLIISKLTTLITARVITAAAKGKNFFFYHAQLMDLFPDSLDCAFMRPAINALAAQSEVIFHTRNGYTFLNGKDSELAGYKIVKDPGTSCFYEIVKSK